VYDPLDRPAVAHGRRGEVLVALRTFGDITPSRYRAAVRSPAAAAEQAHSAVSAQPFFEDSRRELGTYGRWRARHGGVRVRTRLDPRLRRLATTAIHRWFGRPIGPCDRARGDRSGTGPSGR
jgi:membrane peptidoglycan carboxypeptidase